MAIYFVGDSLVSSFNDTSYYYPRYGYGTMMSCYFNGDIKNFALSGRSSKSYVREENYQRVMKELGEGDILIIGFGHNDEKDDDIARFTDASLPLDNCLSFKYSLYHSYIEPARRRGAIPVLCTPVSRITPDEDYSGLVIHNTVHGSYRDAILNLGKEIGVLAIDLTTPTKHLAERLGYERVLKYHAITGGILKDGKPVPNPICVDKTHLSWLGAKYVAYLIAKSLEDSHHPLAKLLKDKILPPKEEELQMNPLFEIIPYEAPCFDGYSRDEFKTIAPWYGTIIGSISLKDGFYAHMDENSFTLGQRNKASGSFVSSSDAFVYVFRQVSIKNNFIISADITMVGKAASKHSGFGIMIRDDCYLPEEKERKIASNFIAGGIIGLDSTSNVIFSRNNPVELTREANTIPGFVSENESIHVEMERLGQAVMVTVQYKEHTFQKTFMDFDFVATDIHHMYVGFFANAGIELSCKNVSFQITGKAKEA